MTVRDSFRGASRQRGSGRLSWSFPIAGNLCSYAELFKGYRESLINDNHNVTSGTWVCRRSTGIERAIGDAGSVGRIPGPASCGAGVDHQW